MCTVLFSHVIPVQMRWLKKTHWSPRQTVCTCIQAHIYDSCRSTSTKLINNVIVLKLSPPSYIWRRVVDGKGWFIGFKIDSRVTSYHLKVLLKTNSDLHFFVLVEFFVFLFLITNSRFCLACVVAGLSASCWPFSMSCLQSLISMASQPEPT